MNSASNDAYRLFSLRSAACWETDQEELRMKLDSVSIVGTAPTNTSRVQFQHFDIFALFRTKQIKGRRSSATTWALSVSLATRLRTKRRRGGGVEKKKSHGKQSCTPADRSSLPSAVRHGGRGRRRWQAVIWTDGWPDTCCLLLRRSDWRRCETPPPALWNHNSRPSERAALPPACTAD